MASFIFFMYVGFIGGIGLWKSSRPSRAGDVQGVSSSLKAENSVEDNQIPLHKQSNATLALNNTVNGIGVIELNLESPMQITDARLEFKVEGDLLIKDIECGRSFECLQVAYNEESIALYLVGANKQFPRYLQGKITVATIYYDESTSAELVLNGDQSKSGVATLGSSNNLISEDIQYLAIGRKNL